MLPLHQNHIYTDLPPYPFGAASQSYLRCCLPGCSPHFAPDKSSQLSRCAGTTGRNNKVLDLKYVVRSWMEKGWEWEWGHPVKWLCWIFVNYMLLTAENHHPANQGFAGFLTPDWYKTKAQLFTFQSWTSKLLKSYFLIFLSLTVCKCWDRQGYWQYCPPALPILVGGSPEAEIWVIIKQGVQRDLLSVKTQALEISS